MQNDLPACLLLVGRVEALHVGHTAADMLSGKARAHEMCAQVINERVVV